MNKKEKTARLFVVTYLYVSPADTLAKNEDPNVETNTMVGTLEEIINFTHLRFDGYNTFEEYYKPEILEHFEEQEETVYFADDDSAGQWFSIAEIINGKCKEVKL